MKITLLSLMCYSACLNRNWIKQEVPVCAERSCLEEASLFSCFKGITSAGKFPCSFLHPVAEAAQGRHSALRDARGKTAVSWSTPTGREVLLILEASDFSLVWWKWFIWQENSWVRRVRQVFSLTSLRENLYLHASLHHRGLSQEVYVWRRLLFFCQGTTSSGINFRPETWVQASFQFNFARVFLPKRTRNCQHFKSLD